MFLYVLPITLKLSHLYPYITPLFFVILSLFLGDIRRILMVLFPLKVDLDAYLTTTVLETFA